MSVMKWTAALLAVATVAWWGFTDTTFHLTTPFSEAFIIGIGYGSYRYGLWKGHR